jgi:drug/metabolite transporter (DMT)-like permease
LGAGLALAASLLWGASDFLGGGLSRRLPPATVIAASQLLATLLLGAYVAGIGPWRAGAGQLALAAAAGLLWVAGTGAFYQALATGVMGVVAPVAPCGMVVPVLAGVARGERPGAAQLAGVAAACAGVFCCGGPELRTPGARAARPLLLAGVAALAFGGEIVLLAGAGRESIPMTLIVMRLTAVAVVGAVVLRAGRPLAVTRADLPALAVLGVLDVAAMGAFLLASRHGAMSLVAVLASLYPAVTVLLARRFHAERLRPVQAAGVVITLVGAVCIAVGGVAA